MNEPHPGDPDNYSGQPTSEPSQPPTQPSGPPDSYSGPPAQHSGPPAQHSSPPPATYEPTRQYPAQPYATGQAAPQYGTPSYGASDSYAQPAPGYAQPDAGYGQPGPYGQPPYPSAYGTAPYAYPAPTKNGLSTTAIVLIVLAVVAVIGGGAGAVVALRSSTSTSSAGPATPALTSPTRDTTTAAPSTPPPSTGGGGGANSIFALPKTAAGMTLSTDSGLGDIMSESLPDGVAGETTTGLYQDDNDRSKILILVGTQAKLGNPDVAVVGVFAGIGQSPSIKLKSPKTYNAGSQGGAMECASGSLSESGQNVPVGVCAVADSHGLILTIFTSRSASSAASATRKLRPSFEHS